LGTVPQQGLGLVYGYDPVHDKMWVGRPASNIVTRFDQVLFVDAFESP
jgi:hypothetical protein